MDQKRVGKSELYLLIRNNESIVYEGTVKAITSYNENGRFDIIPLHTNFISIIKERLLIHEMSGKTRTISVERGVLKVMENKVYVFLGVESLTE